MKLEELTRDWRDAPTCIVDHGANPGLISHFAKQGLLDIAHRMLDDGIAKDPQRLKRLILDQDFGMLAREVGIRVIHCSERDSQISPSPKQVDEFVGTWSIVGLREEGIAPAELGWGTHEKNLPPMPMYRPEGPGNEIMRPDGDQYLGPLMDP